MNANDHLNKGIDVYIDGVKRLTNIVTGSISAPATLPKVGSSIVEFVSNNDSYHANSIIKRCEFSESSKKHNAVVMLDTSNQCRIFTFK